MFLFKLRVLVESCGWRLRACLVMVIENMFGFLFFFCFEKCREQMLCVFLNTVLKNSFKKEESNKSVLSFE